MNQEFATAFIQAVLDGKKVQDDQTSQLYKALRQIAHNRMLRERSDHTLQPTALVNEAYLRLFSQNGVKINNRAHFMAIAANVMRRVLIDYARARDSKKRGGDQVRVTFTGNDPIEEQNIDLLALDEQLNLLKALEPRQAAFVEMRFFGGLSIEEITEATNLARSTVAKDLARAQRWLEARLK